MSIGDRLKGQNRIEVDRMWRSSEIRRQFEAETGLTEEGTEAYNNGFIEWALERIPDAAQETRQAVNAALEEAAKLVEGAQNAINERLLVGFKGWRDGTNRAVFAHAIRSMKSIAAQPLAAPVETKPFYGAQCPTYPNCSGGCGLGCTHEVKQHQSCSASNAAEALRHYADQYCEGWCKDAPANANFDDCGGCRARLALNSAEPQPPAAPVETGRHVSCAPGGKPYADADQWGDNLTSFPTILDLLEAAE